MNILKYFNKTKEDEKQSAVNGIMNELFNRHPAFTPIEQTEIINRVMVNLMSRKKEDLSTLIKQARELKESIKELNI